ncbi:MAG: tRNA (adenosine(37)-N6)-threonylcarbamoyltransferase complex transferase subunit TsaD [bacterium]|nr:tRNA (adenosine(37)-N6)-threonylcarbamoyltransferase complex transferase subunit TsaD [bacterium]
MKILSIETSCDETAVALLEIKGALEKPDIKVLGNTLLSQMELHEKYGGVYPNLAKREHEKNLPILLKKTLEEARLASTNDSESRRAGENLENPNVDCIAVTAGPGLEPALWVGITTAEALGKKWDKPVVPVNHMEGHIFSVLHEARETLVLPALALLVSGGHTELVYVKDFGDYEIVGRTRDDAVGEAFDKTARMLGLTYPGGPKISKLAEISRKRNIVGREFPDADSEQTTIFRFPRPMIHSKDLDFSFSGLKTAVLYKLKSENRPDSDSEFKEDMARAFEDAAVEVLVEKTRQALEKFSDVKTLIVAGGVAANLHLSQEVKKLVSEFPDINLRMPTKSLTTDNAIMIGIAAFIKVSQNPDILKDKTPITARGNLSLS